MGSQDFPDKWKRLDLIAVGGGSIVHNVWKQLWVEKKIGKEKRSNQSQESR